MGLFKKNQNHYEFQGNLSFGRQAFIFFWEIFKVVVISLAIIIPVRYFLIKPFYVKGASMEPNFYDHEYLIIDEITYRFSEPQRGDVVVFRYPLETKQHFIKRVIGLPQEKIIISEGKIHIFSQENPKGQILNEAYLLPAMKTFGDIEIELDSDEYYLLGDNRTASLDSRAFGPVKKNNIVGRTLFRGWPLDRVGLVLFKLPYNLE